MEAASEELWEYKVPERRRRTPSPSSSSSRDESTSGQSQESESLPQRRAESYESITPELTSDTGRSRSAVVVMMTSRTPWSISRRRSVGTELVVRVKSIVVEVRCSPNLAVVCRSGVVGVDPDGAMEAVEHAETRDTVRGDKKLEDVEENLNRGGALNCSDFPELRPEPGSLTCSG